MSAVSVRLRVHFGSALALGPGKIELLERIGQGGSLSQAAREMKMSYRRAWLLIHNVNDAFREPAVTLSKGGRGGGGAALTEFGQMLIGTYRGLEADLERRVRTKFGALVLKSAR
jgi:molybdate transport system regulatory protein